MKKLLTLAILIIFTFSIAFASGGHYKSGKGSSHKGGHYRNSATHNHYKKRR